MILVEKDNKSEILAFVPSIKANISEWQIITVLLPDNKNAQVNLSNPDKIIRNFLKIYEDKEGLCFQENSKKLIIIIRMGEVKKYSDLKRDVEDKLKDQQCRVIVKPMTKAGLKQVEFNLSDLVGETVGNKMFEQREVREPNKVIIADDDEFVRKTLVTYLNGLAELHEVESGEQVYKKYIEINPDILILDIHMPNKNGLDTITEVLEADPDSFIVISSADSVKENVLTAISNGAIGFLAKPIQKNRLNEYLRQCITFKRKAA